MKDPCDDCLVVAGCTQICPKKENYETLISQAVQNYRRFQPNEMSPRFRQRHANLLKHYHNKSTKHYLSLRKINTRRSGGS